MWAAISSVVRILSHPSNASINRAVAGAMYVPRSLKMVTICTGPEFEIATIQSATPSGLGRQFSPAATKQDIPSGEVTIMVQVSPVEEVKTSIKPPPAVRPTATGASSQFSASRLNIASRSPHTGSWACEEPAIKTVERATVRKKNIGLGS